MAKEKIDPISKEIKKIVEEKKAIIGTLKTVKGLKLGKVQRVYVTTNCPDKVKQDIDYYSKLSKAEVIQLKQTNEELGIICKKPFSISVLSVMK